MVNYQKSNDFKYGQKDSVRQRFTGYQKDEETNLDFAEARMYQNQHGRFTTIDPLLASGKSANPQTFNRYVYVVNNPLSYIDPTGMQVGNHSGTVYVSPDGHTFANYRDKGYKRYKGRSQIILDGGYWYEVTRQGWTNLGPVEDLAANNTQNESAPPEDSMSASNTFDF